MIPYLILDFFLALLICLGKKGDSLNHFTYGKGIINIKYLLYCFSFLYLWLFMGFRGAFTQDHISYLQLFDLIKAQSFKETFFQTSYYEKGYLLLNKVVSVFTSDSDAFMVLISFLFVFLVLHTARKLTDDIFLFVFLFVNTGIYFLSFNMIRQALAAAVVFFSYRMWIEKKYVPFGIGMIVAISIHTTAIVVIASYFFLIQRINVKNALKMIVVSVIALLSVDFVISFVQQYRYSGYSWGMDAGTINAFIVQLTLCCFSWIVIYSKKVDVGDIKYRVLINSSILYVMFSVLSLVVYQASRLCYFYSTPVMLLTCESLSVLKKKNEQIVKLLLVIVLIAYMYVWLNGTGYDPYYTFFRRI